jgi:hypothetical protein
MTCSLLYLLVLMSVIFQVDGLRCLHGGVHGRGRSQGAKSAVMTAHKRSDPISKWAAALRDRAGWQKAVVALANKNARILWAVMTKGDAFDARHVSIKPGAAMAAAAST